MAYDPQETRHDIPEADRAEQEREVRPEQEENAEDDTVAPKTDHVSVDPFQADEADQLDQATAVPGDEDDDYDHS